jgi:hypothetical protein
MGGVAARERAPRPSSSVSALRLPDAVLLAIALALPALTYYPITRNYFLYDDFLHLYHIVNDRLLKFLLDMHGGHLLVVRNAVFALCYSLFGTDTAPYFWLALVTHLINVWLLFRIIRELTGSGYLACFGAALWGMLPAHEHTLGWYSVYGQALAATCTLAVLLGLARASNGWVPSRLTPLLWALLMIAAALCFGVGIGAAAAMPIAAWLLLPASHRRLAIAGTLAVVAAGMPFLYYGLEHLYVSLYGGLPPSTWLGAGMLYWQTLVQLALSLFASGMLAIVHGPFAPLADAPSTADMAMVAAYVTVLLAVLVAAPALTRRRLAACLVIAGGVYGVIGLGRGLFVTGSKASWWFAHTPRYHYLGTAPLAIATCLLLAEIGRRWEPRPWLRSALLLVWLSASLITQLAFAKPIDHFEGPRREVAWVKSQFSTAMHAVCRGNDVYILNRNFRSLGGPYLDRHDIFPGWAAVFAIYFPSDVVAGRRIHFVEDDPVAAEIALEGRRTASLIVSSKQAPPDVYEPPERPPLHPPRRAHVRCR